MILLETDKDVDNIYKSIIKGFLIYFVVFSAYLELSPKLGNIWYRIQDDGIRRINPSYLFKFIILPFKHIWMWYPINWDLNYFIGSIISTGLIYYLSIFNGKKI